MLEFFLIVIFCKWDYSVILQVFTASLLILKMAQKQSQCSILQLDGLLWYTYSLFLQKFWTDFHIVDYISDRLQSELQFI